MDNRHNCHVEPIEKSTDETAMSKADFVYLSVSGMGCQTCVTRVRNGLLRLDGVLAAAIDLSYQVAKIAYDPTRVSPGDLIATVAKSGDGRHHYQARLVSDVRPNSETPGYGHHNG